MGWSIGELKNTVEICEVCARELFESQSYEGERWYEVERVTHKGKLVFDEDHMEHMDFVWDEGVQAILMKHRVRGDICFGSLEGDNAGSFWGYRFDGRGGMVKLKGEVVFTEEE